MKLPSTSKILSSFWILLVVFVIGVNVGIYLSEDNTQTSSGEDITVSMSIDYNDEDTQIFADEVLPDGSSVFDLLMAVERRHGVSVEYREFPGVGTFIESIHGVSNTNSQYWQFWVNDEYSNAGADQYTLEDGDEIRWHRTGELPE